MLLFCSMRIDKYCWVVRIYKTRSLATKQCNGGKVKLNNEEVKASKSLKSNDKIAVKNGPIWRIYKVLDFPKSRVAASLVDTYLKEVTPKKELELLKEFQVNQKQLKQSGFKGRPTKLNRRKLNKFKS